MSRTKRLCSEARSVRRVNRNSFFSSVFLGNIGLMRSSNSLVRKFFLDLVKAGKFSIQRGVLNLRNFLALRLAHKPC